MLDSTILDGDGLVDGTMLEGDGLLDGDGLLHSSDSSVVVYAVFINIDIHL